MRLRNWTALICLAWSTIHAQSPPPVPTWKDEIAKNFVPYHQLTTDDFPINDKAHPETYNLFGAGQKRHVAAQQGREYQGQIAVCAGASGLE